MRPAARDAFQRGAGRPGKPPPGRCSTPARGRPVVHDEQLAGGHLARLADAVTQGHWPDGEALEQRADLGLVVDGETEAALDARELVGELREVLPPKHAGAVVTLAAVVRRIEIEKR